ncbi:twin arginine-targeting protein translocase TatB [Gilliamella sp. wkB292]|uniref:Sec-independent protein translocase protein TatB n=1 Tax=Gilliamella sp. wkB292 TaxID=3120262 RepID=UPI00080D908D|nr:Sec-independent protein translocase protein TatB [Gilliamella apicola]OCG11476.1 twin arginine-targeting protein translocase TatB [Gilliamella apicola]
MFDISFGQLLLVMILGLVVLGPERLPVAIKTVAGWIKVLRRMSATVQLELNKELKLQELQNSLKKAEQSGLKTLTPEIQASIDDLKRVTESLQKEIDSAAHIDTPTHSDKDKS